MNLIHFFSKLRYEVKFQAKLEFHDSLLNRIIEIYYHIPYARYGINKDRKNKRNVIISLTTIPSRIDKVWMTIESLLRQTEKPNRILLWIAEDEFEGISIPKILEKQKKRGLEIRYCKNLKSYKKFYYTMQEFPEDFVLTVDDDSIYSEKMVETMLEESAKNPECIICNRSHRVRADKHRLFNYLRWGAYDNRRRISDKPSYQNFFTGNGGVLFPVWLLDKDIFKQDVFMEIAPTADDAWLNFIAWKSNVKTVNTQGILGFVIPIQSSSEKGLFVDNSARKGDSWECENDIQIDNVLRYFNLDIQKYV